MTQQTLDGSPPRVGLWAKVIADGAVDHAAWLRALHEGAFVGSCRCGDFLAPQRPSHVGKRVDYAATCRSGCGWEITAPGGRVLRGSSRKSERSR